MYCFLLEVEFKLFQIYINHAPLILVYVGVGGKFEHLQFYIIYIYHLVIWSVRQNNCPGLGQFLVYLHGTCFCGPKVEPHV